MTSGAYRRLFIATLVALQLGVAGHPARADSKLAEQHYARALEHLRAGELHKAHEAFVRAYGESPHYLVLYNLGLVSLELGRAEAARDYFERYLKQGGDAIPAERRTEVENLIERTRTGAAPPAEGDASLEGDSSANLALEATPAVPSEPIHTSPGVATHTQATDTRRPDEPERPSAPPPPVPAERQRSAAFVLGSAGTALALAGTAVLLWNQGRYARYRETRSELAESRPTQEVTSQAELEAWLGHVRAEERNEAVLASVNRFDIVGWTLAGVGAAALATGVVFYFKRQGPATIAVGNRRVMLTCAW